MCRSRRELSNEYLLAKIGVDTAENEPLEVWGKNSIHYSLHSLGPPQRGAPGARAGALAERARGFRVLPESARGRAPGLFRATLAQEALDGRVRFEVAGPPLRFVVSSSESCAPLRSLALPSKDPVYAEFSFDDHSSCCPVSEIVPFNEMASALNPFYLFVPVVFFSLFVSFCTSPL